MIFGSVPEPWVETVIWVALAILSIPFVVGIPVALWDSWRAWRWRRDERRRMPTPYWQQPVDEDTEP